MTNPEDLSGLDPDSVRPELGYTVSSLGEPHAQRRAEIFARHPEVQRLFGHDATQAWITLGVIALQLGLTAGLVAMDAPWWALVAVAWTIGSIAHHWHGVVIHEASHNTVVPGGEGPNRLFAMVANLTLVIPGAMSFRRYHHDHHLYMGVEGLDNDLPTPFEIRWLGRSAVAKALWIFLFPVFMVFGRGFMRQAPDRWELANLGVQIAFGAGVWALGGWTALAYLLLSTLFAYGAHPIAAHWVHEHYLFEEDQETYSYYGPLNKLTFNMGYHVEHHDFPGIPGSRLPELHELANEYYAPLSSHDSWTGILWRFITEDIGHHSRVVRSYRTFDRTRARSRHAIARGDALARACRAHPPEPGAPLRLASSTSRAVGDGSSSRRPKGLRGLLAS